MSLKFFKSVITLLLIHSFVLAQTGGIKVVGDPIPLIQEEGKYWMKPVWSPDNSRIAFTSRKYQGLWIYNLLDRSIKKVTDEPGAGYGFSWSSDGKEIVCRVSKYVGKKRYSAIKIFNIIDNTERQITEYRTLLPGVPVWALNDRKIYLSHTSSFRLYDSGKLPVQEKGSSSPEKDILFIYKDKLAKGDPETGKFQFVQPVKGRYLNLFQSPDGSMIAFEIIGGDMYVSDVKGNNWTDLGTGYRPQWSPDGKRLVYMITEDDGHVYLSSDIYSINIDGTEKTNLTNTEDKLEMNPSWSPDGRSIAYDVMGEGIIYLIKVKY